MGNGPRHEGVTFRPLGRPRRVRITCSRRAGPSAFDLWTGTLAFLSISVTVLGLVLIVTEAGDQASALVSGPDGDEASWSQLQWVALVAVLVAAMPSVWVVERLWTRWRS